MADLAKLVGARIKRIRKEAGLTQEQLAEKVEVSREFISRIESGSQQPPLRLIADLASTLNVSTRDFFDFAGPIYWQGKLGVKQRKECLESISRMLKELELRELLIAQNIVRSLTQK